MNKKVILYLAIFFATLAFFEAEASKSKNKLAKKAFKACSNLADEVVELNQTEYITVGRILDIGQHCLGQVEKDGTM